MRSFTLKRGWILIILTSLLLVTCPRQARATTPTDTGNQGSGTNYTTNTNPYYANGYYGQCTWFVWGRCADTGWVLNAAPGANTEYTVITNGGGKSPTVVAVGSIECCRYGSSSYHVCYVYHVDSQTQWEIAQWNVPLYAGYSTETITRSSPTSSSLSCSMSGSCSLTGFLYPPGGGSGGAPTSNVPLVGDVTGDHMADAVLVSPNTGDVWVAPSVGSGFSPPVLWSANSTIANATRYFLADVNGDGKADIVAFYASTGSWYVGLSSGGGFWAPTLWATNEGGNSSNQFLADVNGDGKADVVLFWNNVPGMPQGTWAVDESSGSGFYGPPNQWITGVGVGSTSQLVADFNGDRYADVGVYYASTGVWNVCLSTSVIFGYPGTWCSGHGLTSNLQFAGDCSGDGKADIAYFWNSGSGSGTWEIGTSSGGGFWSPTYWGLNQNGSSTVQFLADVNNDGMADQVAYWAAVPGQPAGMWTVDISSGGGFWGPPSQWITGFGDNYR